MAFIEAGGTGTVIRQAALMARVIILWATCTVPFKFPTVLYALGTSDFAWVTCIIPVEGGSRFLELIKKPVTIANTGYRKGLQVPYCT